MKKKLLAMLLTLCMTLSLLPVPAGAVEIPSGSGLDKLGIRQISEKSYAITPDVKEYEWVLNNSALTQQMMGHVMEVKVGEGSKASIAVGYGDDNIEAIAGGTSWTMRETTKQAQSMQSRRKTNVVGAINAGGYDMSNGRPGGAFIMDGTVINRATSTTFWIDMEGNAHITSAQECNAALDSGNVREAVSGFGDIFTDGHATSGLDNFTRASRTAIGIKADGTVVMLMVDGRQAPYSVGMTMAEVGAAMEALGCVQAVNLDGGGSSTFATQREGEPETEDSAGLTLRCRPSDGYERRVSNTLMVLSTAKPTGEFDHAVLTPNNAIYTPGSKVQFTATGVDGAGGSAKIPAGAEWKVLSGGGNIDANGLYTAPDGCGKASIGLMVNGTLAGKTSVQLQWPDTLGFTNASVSIDFGKRSDMTFKPTWQGQEVIYKDGDFVWTLDESKPIRYKYTALVEEKAWEGRDVPKAGFPTWKYSNSNGKIYMPLTGDIGTQKKVEWGSTDVCTYITYFTEQERTISYEGGLITVDEKLTHDKAEMLDLRTNEWTDCTAEQNAERVNLSHHFKLGKFNGNTFVADEKNSLRATVKAALATDPAVSGSVELVVGLEPIVLMNFEDGSYNWNTYVTNGKNGDDATGDNSQFGQLSRQHILDHGMWVRTATSQPIDFTGSGVVSAAEDSRVRFGDKAFKLCFDFKNVPDSNTAATDAGFSCDLYVNKAQPTKIGMWVNVPADLKGCPYQLKAVMAGGAGSTTTAKTDGGYNSLNADGSFTYHGELDANGKGKIPKGTTMYTQYYAKVMEDGREVALSSLGDMAGRGWLWVEADISAMQMPIAIYRGYTFRVVKTPGMATWKQPSHILVDNVQLIYGTNTNDINNPVIESVTEKTTNTMLYAGEQPELPSGSLSFEIAYSDSELTDKYASGIDVGTVRVFVDRVDQKNNAEILAGSLYLRNQTLRNGEHSLTIYLKDRYGNETERTYYFKVVDPQGSEAGIAVIPQQAAPEVGKEFALYVVNVTNEEIGKAELYLDFPESYLTQLPTVEPSSGYSANVEKVSSGRIKLTVQKARTSGAMMAQLMQEYDHEMACLVLRIPESAASDESFAYTIAQATYETSAGSNTFVGTPQKVSLETVYRISAEPTILIGQQTKLRVTDRNGNPQARAEVFCGAQSLGKTGPDGVLKYTFNEAGLKTIHAVKDGSRSQEAKAIVCTKPDEAQGNPFGVQNNAVDNASTAQSITWLSSIDNSKPTAVVRYAENADLTGAKEVSGTSALQFFVQGTSGDALRCNTVSLSGLVPGTQYYYQVGDGEKWSEVYHFTTDTAKAEQTNFFILGDIQTSETSNLSAALGQLKNGSYAFGIQTGDAIDGPTRFYEWRMFFTEMNSGKLNGVNIFHALGNHEYNGDAEGAISKNIFNLPDSRMNSWYSMEYGNVCVVVVNHKNTGENGGLVEATAQIAEQLKTDCAWKVLVTHEPVYGTEGVLSDEAMTAIAANLEKAGIDFVFSGDDNSYARTFPMLGNKAQAEDSSEGIVYYICGDLSGKTATCTKLPCHAKVIERTKYQGMYMTATANEARMTINAYKYDGTLLDSYTKQRTNCELGKHTFDETSKYDMANHTASCVLCGQQSSVPATFSGLLETTDGAHVLLVDGKPLTNTFRQLGETMYHACANGYTYASTAKDNGTCTTSGSTTYTCPSCKAAYDTQKKMPNGHKWDASHVCEVCGFHGIDINGPEVDIQLGTPEKPIGKDAVGYRYGYKPNGTVPYFYAKHGDTLLGHSTGNRLDNGKIVDLFVEYQNSKQVGKATVKITGRGDYYGDTELYYYIYPKAPGELKADKVVDTFAKLSWTVASGADEYEIYTCNANNSSRKLFAKIGNTTSYTATGLEKETTYCFVIRGLKTVDDKVYTSSWSNVLTFKTNADSADVRSMTASVDGQKIELTNVKGVQYLFLPASADLTQLSLAFERSEDKGALVLSGDKGSVTLESPEQTVDLTALASKSGDAYTFTAKIGGGEALTVRVMRGSGIPTLYLTSSVEGEDRGFVDASKENKTSATALMTAANGATIYDGGVKALKARGNSTFLHAKKKSYQMKLPNGADLLGTGEQVKTWVLLAGYFDATQMHDKLMKDLAAQLGLDYTASCGWVNLYYDGEYRGVYLMSEKNGINETSVNIHKLEEQYELLNKNYGKGMQVTEGMNSLGNTVRYTQNVQDPWAAKDAVGGYLLEMNYHTMEEDSCFMTTQGYAINVKSPEWCGKEAMDYISEFYQGFEDAVYAQDENGNYTGVNAEGKHYYDYVDKESLVKTFVLQELGKNCDGFRYSQFFYYSNGKLFVGPIWDQEMTFGTGWSGYSDPDTMTYFDLGEALIRIPDFKAAVQEYYSTFRAAAGGLENSVNAHYAKLSDSAAMNYVMWPYIRVGNPDAAGHIWQGASYSSVIGDLQSWITRRLSKLDEVYAGIPEVMRGDLDGDGEISLLDIRLLYQYLAGTIELTEAQMKAADVNGDSEVDVMDARWMYEYFAGLRDENFDRIN